MKTRIFLTLLLVVLFSNNHLFAAANSNNFTGTRLGANFMFHNLSEINAQTTSYGVHCEIEFTNMPLSLRGSLLYHNYDVDGNLALVGFSAYNLEIPVTIGYDWGTDGFIKLRPFIGPDFSYTNISYKNPVTDKSASQTDIGVIFGAGAYLDVLRPLYFNLNLNWVYIDKEMSKPRIEIGVGIKL